MFVVSKIIKFYQKFKYRKMRCGLNVNLGIYTKVMNPQNVVIGDNSYINSGNIHAGKHCKIVIGQNCCISYNVFIRTTTHNYLRKDKLIKDQGIYEKDIIIEDDCWIGSGVTILPGVHIEQGVVVGSGSVVTKNLESYCVYAGIPAKKIKTRV